MNYPSDYFQNDCPFKEIWLNQRDKDRYETKKAFAIETLKKARQKRRKLKAWNKPRGI